MYFDFKELFDAFIGNKLGTNTQKIVNFDIYLLCVLPSSIYKVKCCAAILITSFYSVQF